MANRFVCAVVLLVCAGEVSAQSLERAYRNEIAVLESEKSALEAALSEAEKSAAIARRALETDIEKLSAELIRLRADNAAMESTLPAREALRSSEDQEKQLRDLVEQIDARLARAGEKIDSPAEGPELLPLVIEATLERMERHGGLHLDENVQFFGRDGSAERGTVLHIGEVGAIALDGARPLAPAADGSLRVMPVPGSLREVGPGKLVELVLYDPQQPPDPERLGDTGVMAWMRAGGPLMWPLVVLGLLAVLIAIERGLALVVAGRGLRAVADRTRQWLAKGAVVGDRAPELPGPAWLSRPAEQIADLRRPREQREEQATEALLRLRGRLRRRLTVLTVTSAAAPLLGLLGTVTGMITTFAVITEHGTGDPQLVSDGISQALLTTQLGLAVAIPALLAGVGLRRWAQRIFAAAEELVVDVHHQLGHLDDHSPTEDIRG